MVKTKALNDLIIKKFNTKSRFFKIQDGSEKWWLSERLSKKVISKEDYRFIKRLIETTSNKRLSGEWCKELSKKVCDNMDKEYSTIKEFCDKHAISKYQVSVHRNNKVKRLTPYGKEILKVLNIDYGK